MEVRKVQITGGSTYTVSLSKEWTTETGIEAGQELAFYPDGDTLIAASPIANEARTTLSIEDASLQELESQIVTLYVNGFDEIAFEADRIATDQRRVIRSTAQTLTGFEVSTETETRIVLQDFLDASELSIHDTVMQMRLLSLSMLEDATEALFEEQPGTAEEISERDDEVDRLWHVTSRLFRSVLRAPRVAASTDLGNESYFDYRTCARQIERIADHTVKIASHSDELETLPENIREPFAALKNESHEVVENAMDAFLVDHCHPCVLRR
ncbi:PhoU domain protein [Halalkalicoccus paucihalophilus]|uniref:PhoU domain protein n=1 Tax=Halalkalicoccus paucihalophilus TaxID=1008153 RepID=A0A151A989_9EURY|nr:phosphate uptake regulator PhoU [Halalkalicoccus paucihalophilus]KYH24120.1 PhoU domain protein [Halalkalicoccus paucihalophilus]